MDIKIARGKYILGVSGGVDSMVLLDLLAKKPGVEVIVAHFNHGIRPDSRLDEEFVRQKAASLGLPFESALGNLGPGASEDTARRARYTFLREAKRKYRADALITAHHQDDLIETAFLNLLRGTGRRGLVSISANGKVLRPLLGYPKKTLVAHAKKNKLEWREDQSNLKDKYLRNYIRNNILPALSDDQRKDLLKNIDKVAEIETEITPLIANLSHYICKDSKIDRGKFIELSSGLGDELIMYWLRRQRAGDFDKKTVRRLNAAIRTMKAGTKQPVKKGLELKIGPKSAQFTHTL